MVPEHASKTQTRLHSPYIVLDRMYTIRHMILLLNPFGIQCAAGAAVGRPQSGVIPFFMGLGHVTTAVSRFSMQSLFSNMTGAANVILAAARRASARREANIFACFGWFR